MIELTGLGAYSTRPETGLLISSHYVNNRGALARFRRKLLKSKSWRRGHIEDTKAVMEGRGRAVVYYVWSG